jgi:pimeloyl-ACP methyl ester carboxylesterase
MPVRSSRVELPGQGDVGLIADRWARDEPPRGTVLLLHGGGQTRRSWAATAGTLAADGWEAFAIDARGHGESDWAPDGDYSIDAMISDLLAMCAGMAHRPVIVGASMGGMTALIAQGEHPALSRGVVLVDVTPRIDPSGSEEVIAFMRSGAGGFGSIEEAADAVVAYNPRRERPPRLDGLRKNLRVSGDRWYWHWDPRLISGIDDGGDETPPSDGGRSVNNGQDALQVRARAAARSLSVPVLLIRGAESRVVSSQGAAELQALVPNARRFDVDGTGHMVAGDDNDVFCGELLDFLNTLPGAHRG